MKNLKSALAISLILACLSVTAFAFTGTVQNITAQLRPDLAVKIDGYEKFFRNADGKVVYPIVYEGTTYLPIRAIGQLMDKDVEWNQSEQSVQLNPKKHDDDDHDDDKYDDDITMRIMLPHSSTGDNKTSSFVATDDDVEFEIVSATMTTTYNVTLYKNDGTKVKAYTDIRIGEDVEFKNVVVGGSYYFKISSNDCPQNGVNAICNIDLD